MLPKDLRDKPQSEVYLNSIEQFGRELSQFFRDKDYVPTFLVKGDEDIKDLRDEKTSDKFSIPLFTYKLNSLEPNRDRFNRNALRRHGIAINTIAKPKDGERADDPNRIYNTHHLQPADLSIDIEYFCSYDDQMTFAPLWQQAAAGHYLNFQMELGEALLSFNVELNESVTYSTIDFDNSRYVRAQTSAVLTTYHGVVSENKPANSYRVNTGIVSHAPEGNELVPSMEIKRSKSTTFSIKHANGEPNG